MGGLAYRILKACHARWNALHERAHVQYERRASTHSSKCEQFTAICYKILLAYLSVSECWAIFTPQLIDFSAWFDRKILDWVPGNFCILSPGLCEKTNNCASYIFQPTDDIRDVATVGGRARHSNLEPTTDKQFKL